MHVRTYTHIHAHTHARVMTPAGGTYVVDKLLIPRLDTYAANHSLEDVDAVAEALRSTYKEYQRRQMAPFKQMVLKAVRVMQARSQVRWHGVAGQQIKHNWLARTIKNGVYTEFLARNSPDTRSYMYVSGQP